MIVKKISFFLGISLRIKKAKNKVENIHKKESNTEIESHKYEITTRERNQENQDKNQEIDL